MERGRRKEKPINRQFCELVQEELANCFCHKRTPLASWIIICRLLGGEVFRVPTNHQPKRERIIKALEKGEYTDAQIVERYGVSRTYVWQIRKEVNKNNKK